MAQAKVLSKHQINRVLDTCLLMSNSSQKRAVLALSFSSLRITEISRITVSDLLTKSGRIKDEIYIRADIAKRCRPRHIWLSKNAKKLIQEYIDGRVAKHMGINTGTTDYQGLNPMSCFIFSSRGAPYSMKIKTKYNYQGKPVQYESCDSLEAEVRRIFLRCGLKGCSSHSGRRSRATELNKQGVDLLTSSKMLGHADEQVSLRYIEIGEQQMQRVFELAL